MEEISSGILKAYRWQYIVSGVGVERFQKALGEKISAGQFERVTTVMTPIVEHVEDFSPPTRTRR